jgi:hypothetical protein
MDREVDGSIMVKIFETGCIPLIWDESFSRQPLNQRRWVLQERQLSQRALHYTKSKLLWECRSLRACDDIPWGLSHGSATRKPRVLDGREGSWKGDIFNAWHTMTQDYSSMLLTRDTDKLGALSGLAKEVQRSLASNYIAGIWEDNSRAAYYGKLFLEKSINGLRSTAVPPGPGSHLMAPLNIPQPHSISARVYSI